MQVKDLKLTISPEFDLREIPRFINRFKKGMFRAGGALAKGFSRAYTAAGKTSMYAQFILSGLRNIYEVLTRTNRTIEKGWNLATNTLRKTSRATGLTEGQVASVAYGFSTLGINEEQTTEMLQAFALQQQITNPYSQDPANLGDKFYSALTELSQLDDRIARNALSQQYFNMSAEKGSIIDLMINEVEKAKAGTRNFSNVKNVLGMRIGDPEKITRQSMITTGLADKAVADSLIQQISILLGSAGKESGPDYEKYKFRRNELKDLYDPNSTLKNIQGSVDMYTSIQAGVMTVTKALSAQILNLINENLGGVEGVVNGLVASFKFLIKQIEHLTTAIQFLVRFIGGAKVENLSNPDWDPNKSFGDNVMMDLDLKREQDNYMAKYGEQARKVGAVYTDKYGNERVDTKKLLVSLGNYFKTAQIPVYGPLAAIYKGVKAGVINKKILGDGNPKELADATSRLYKAENAALKNARSGKRTWKKGATPEEIAMAKKIEKEDIANSAKKAFEKEQSLKTQTSRQNDQIWPGKQS